MAENFPNLIKNINSETKKLNKSQEAEVQRNHSKAHYNQIAVTQ